MKTTLIGMMMFPPLCSSCLNICQRSSSPLKEPNDVYASGYDLVIADPPHYLTFDYLCQPITWPRKGSDQGMPAAPMPLYEYLAFLAGKGKLRAFILYFGHKEKEWISLEMHRMLTDRKWRHVWSLLIGDERFVVCFGPRGIGSPECEGLLASAVKDGLNRYTKDRNWFKVAIYDTFNNWMEVTRGPLGIPSIPHPRAESIWPSLRAIREDEVFAQAAGKSTLRFKVTAFAVSAALAARGACMPITSLISIPRASP